LRIVVRLMGCLIAISALGVAGGCGGSVPVQHHAAATPPPAAPVPASPADPRVAALEAYAGMWHAFVVASHSADYQSQSLAHYAAGSALSELTHGLYANYQKGIVTRGEPSFDPKVTIATPAGGTVQASVTDCADSSHWRNYYKSGKPAGSPSVARERIEAQLQLFGGVWKVTYLVVEKEGTC